MFKGPLIRGVTDSSYSLQEMTKKVLIFKWVYNIYDWIIIFTVYLASENVNKTTTAFTCPQWYTCCYGSLTLAPSPKNPPIFICKRIRVRSNLH